MAKVISWDNRRREVLCVLMRWFVCKSWDELRTVFREYLNIATDNFPASTLNMQWRQMTMENRYPVKDMMVTPFNSTDQTDFWVKLREDLRLWIDANHPGLLWLLESEDMNLMRQIDKAYSTESARKAREAIAKRVAKTRAETLKVVRKEKNRVMVRISDDLCIVTEKTARKVKVKVEEKDDETDSQGLTVPLRKKRKKTKASKTAPHTRQCFDESGTEDQDMENKHLDDEEMEYSEEKLEFMSNDQTSHLLIKQEVYGSSPSPEPFTRRTTMTPPLSANAPRLLFRLMDESDQITRRWPGRPRTTPPRAWHISTSTTSSLMCVIHSAMKSEDHVNIAIIDTSKLNAELRQMHHTLDSDSEIPEVASYQEENEYSIIGTITPAAVINTFSLYDIFDCACANEGMKDLLRLEMITIGQNVSSVRNKLAKRELYMPPDNIQDALEILSKFFLGIPEKKLRRDPWDQHDMRMAMNELLAKEWMLKERTGDTFKLTIAEPGDLSNTQEDAVIRRDGLGNDDDGGGDIYEEGNIYQIDSEESWVEEKNKAVTDGESSPVEMDVDDDWW